MSKDNRLKIGIIFVALTLLLTWLLLPTFSFANAETPIHIENSWAKPTLKGQNMGVAYLTLENHGTDAVSLVDAVSPVAERIEIHTHIHGENGMMQMRQVQELDLQPNEKQVFEPGGLHLMLFGLKEPLAAGDSFPLMLKFDDVSEQLIKVEVRKQDG